MASFEIQNFRPGLDTRRYELTSVPGTLETLINAHINQGGEIENRKTIAPIPSAQFAATFGAQETATGIYVFGTATVGVLPTGFNYLKLTHPAVIAGTTYDPAKHAMTGVVTSCLFGDYPFVVATFTDGTTWAYYAQLVAGVVTSVLVSDFTAGVVLAYLVGNNAGLAQNIANLIAATSVYDLTVNTGGVAATAQITTTAFAPADGDTVTIGTVIYRWKNTPAQINDVQIEALYTLSLRNLYYTINGTSNPSYCYPGTVKHPQVHAVPPLTGTTFSILANATGLSGNLINISTTGATLRWNTTTLTGGSSGLFVDIFGPPGEQYTTNIINNSSAGTLTAQIKNQGLASLPGTQAFGQFQIVAGASGTNNFVSNVKIVGASGQAGINLLYGGNAVNWVTTPADTAIAVANSISQYAPTTGFYAIASSSTVLIYAVTIGTTTNNLPITVTVNQNVTTNDFNICIGNCAITFSGTATPTFSCSSITVAGGANLLSGTVTGTVLGTVVSDIAQNINANAVGYVACATGATLNLSKITTASTDPSAAVVVTSTGGLTAGAGSAGSAVISLSTYNESTTAIGYYNSINSGLVSKSGSLQPLPVSVILGGVTNAPYTYQWNTVTASPGIKITTASETLYQAVFSTTTISFPALPYRSGSITYTAVFNCTVTDASSVSVTTDDVTVIVIVDTPVINS